MLDKRQIKSPNCFDNGTWYEAHVLQMQCQFWIMEHYQLTKHPQILRHDSTVVFQKEVVDVLPYEGFKGGVR